MEIKSLDFFFNEFLFYYPIRTQNIRSFSCALFSGIGFYLRKPIDAYRFVSHQFDVFFVHFIYLFTTHLLLKKKLLNNFSPKNFYNKLIDSKLFTCHTFQLPLKSK
jgi:hypothetical protein